MIGWLFYGGYEQTKYLLELTKLYVLNTLSERIELYLAVDRFLNFLTDVRLDLRNRTRAARIAGAS